MLWVSRAVQNAVCEFQVFRVFSMLWVSGVQYAVGFRCSVCCGLQVFRVFSMLWASGVQHAVSFMCSGCSACCGFQVFRVFNMLWVSGVLSVQHAVGFMSSA